MEITGLNSKDINQPRANPIDSLIKSLQSQLIYSTKAETITDLDKETGSGIKTLKTVNKIGSQSLINEEQNNGETSSETGNYNLREDLSRLRELIEGRRPIDNVQELREVIAVLKKLKIQNERNRLVTQKAHFWDRSHDMKMMANFFKDNKAMLNNVLDWLSYYNKLYSSIEI